ncbi:TRAP transporter permease [Salibacterium sp. K-3]
MSRIVTRITFLIAIALSIFHLYTGVMGSFTAMMQRGIHLFLILLLVFLLYSFKSKSTRMSWFNIFLLISTIILAIMTLPGLTPDAQMSRGTMGPTSFEEGQAWSLIILILIATKLVLGWAMVIIASLLIGYSFLGPYLPSILYHTGVSPSRLSEQLVWTTEGIFGTPLAVASTFVALFILFGVLLEETGAGKFFINLAYAAAGRFRGGPAQTAVLSSGLMGSISGSSVSNVATTGTFTIPLMKKMGYPNYIAGGIEAVSSTGGQIMPPVMGAVAFVMADMTGLSYAEIILAALIPAMLFYVALSTGVYFEARKAGLEKKNKSELPNAIELLKNGFYLFVPLIVLIICILGLEWSPSRSALFTIASTFIILITQSIVKEGKFPIHRIFHSLQRGAQMLIPVSTACATAGIMIGIFGATGLGIRFSQSLIDLASGMLIPALLLMMLACLILGMGLPTTAAYIITAVLGAKALVELGVPLIAAHLFILYFAILSFITPPVALSAFTASGIAASKAMKTSISAWRLGLSGYIIPFMFVYNSHLLGEGNFGEILTAAIPAIFGVGLLSIATTGWLVVKTNFIERLLIFTAAVLLVIPDYITATISLVFFLPVLFFQLKKAKQQEILHSVNIDYKNG